MQNFMIALLICSVAMSGLALLYMAATPFLAKRYSEKWRYYAWLIIIVGLIVPFRPQWGDALINVEVPTAAQPPVVQVGGEASSHFTPTISLPTLPPVESVTLADTALNISWWHIGFAVWLAGAMVFIAVQGIKHCRFNKAARRWGKGITDTQVLSMLEGLKSEMGISREIPIYLCPIAGSPMMVGLFKPRILLPTAEPAQDELRFILKHELVHYKRKDLLYKYLVLTATALHWFNPIVHLIAKAVNALCETSCDAEVLRNADVETRQFYGETIIGVVKYQSKLQTVLSTNFYGGRKGMTKRIASIMDTRSKRAGMIVTCLVLLLAIGTGFILAASPTQAESVSENTAYNTEKPTTAEQNPSTQNTEAENSNNSNTTQTQPIASETTGIEQTQPKAPETTDNDLPQPTENEITMFSLQPGLMPGERELEPGESWPLADNHGMVELFDNNGDVGVRHSMDGGETWMDGPAFITLGDDLLSEQEIEALLAETPPTPRTIDVDFNDIESMMEIFVILPDEIGEVIDIHNDPEIQAMIQAGATMQEIFAVLLERW